MKIFFDTEFTGLRKDTTLISIGLIDEEGRTFYAEFNDYDPAHIRNNEWIYDNVIRHLQWGAWGKDGSDENFVNIYTNAWEAWGDTQYIKNVLTDWLWKYDNVELVSDVCHYDMVLFIDIFDNAFNIPNNVSPACHDINQDIASFYHISEKEAFDKSREAILEDFNNTIEGDKHNSLYDACVIKEIYNNISKTN